MASANNLGTAYIRIAPQMQGIQSTITKQLGGLGSSVGTQFSNNFTAKWGKAAGAIAGATAAIASKALNAVTDSIDTAIKRIDTLNAFPKIMKNLGFEAEESDSALSKLSDRIEGLPTTLDGIVTYTQRLASTTGNLNKGMYNATNLAIAFNDAALAGGKGQYEANRAFEQFSQVISRSRPTMQDWKIMMEVMPGQLKQLAKYMGVNNKSLQAYAKDAKKTVDQLDGMDLYAWISENKNEFAKERLADLQKALIDLDNKGGAGITSFKDQVGDATHTIGNALGLIPIRIAKALAQIINAFGSNDIYTTIDKFTSSFKKVGDWIIRYIVPPIKKDVIPVLKGVVTVIKNVIKWVAETEAVRKTLGGLLKAFIAFKVVTAVWSTIAKGALIFKSLANVITGVTTVVKALHAGLSVTSAFSAAAGATTGLTAKVATLGATATAAHGSFSLLATKVGLFTVAAGAAVAAGLTLYTAIGTLADANKRAENAAKRHAERLVNEENALKNVNRSLELQKDLLDDITKAKNTERDAEKESILSKQAVKDAQAEVNRLAKAGKKGTDEYRLAEIELAEAQDRRKTATENLAKAKKEVASAEESERANRMTELNETNKLRLAAESRAGNYAAIAAQLDNLKNKTYQYKDANGKLVSGTKQDMQNTIAYLGETLGKQDATWKKIYDDAVKNGTSFSEACKKYGTSGAKGLTGNFATGVTKWEPLATNAAKDLGNDIGWGLEKGLKGWLGKVTNLGKSLAQSVIDSARKEAKSHSPSRKMIDLGRDMAEGLNIGLSSMNQQLEQTARATTATVIDAMAGQASIGLSTGYQGVGASNGQAPTPAQVIQNNTFNQVANNLDVKEASRKLGWEVATAI